MKFIMEDKAILEGIKPETERHIRNLFTIENPKFVEAVKMGRYTRNMEPMLKFWHESLGTLSVPRGAGGIIYQILMDHGESFEFIDNRRSLEPVDFEFQGSLRPLQAQAVNIALECDFGVLEAGTGSGKTVMALYMIAARKQPALVVVHTRELMHQWVDRIEQFLNIPRQEIGIIGGGKCQMGDRITVSMVQTLFKATDQAVEAVGHLVVDECHRIPSRTFTEAVTAFDCRYMTGLSATPFRRDGLTRALHWTLGPVTGRIEKQDLLQAGSLCQARVCFIKTDFSTLLDVSDRYSQALSELTTDQARNNLICKTVAGNQRPGSGNAGEIFRAADPVYRAGIEACAREGQGCHSGFCR